MHHVHMGAGVGLPPTIEWVNHAGFLLEADGVGLLSDPWLSGTAFNRGWRHISPTRFTLEDFARVTHLWFSHQHPDHFAPADLRRIDPGIRARIVVLYHHTIDKKVVRFCESLGFRELRELRDREWVALSPSVEILCGTWFDRDSWLAVRANGTTFLNLNDCVVDSPGLARKIRSLCGNVDVLLTQFSYAEWAGNPEDARLREASAAEKLRRIRIQCETFEPAWVIPFASFIYWCHPENFFMNDEMNEVLDVASFIESRLHRRPIVLYPGDRWTAGKPHDWQEAARAYHRDFRDRIAEGATEVPKS
ncbi:MAG: MBL fold metallo-hydrolase, partial [Candidatus Eremiobacteraeota bacterium]|nr:MBL fold metallo-hydrolase [Candidatus Eremiobacteraeota bacterium]